MSTYIAFYVRKTATDDSITANMLSLEPTAVFEPLTEFIGAVIDPPNFEPPEASLAELSARFATDVIWLCYQTTANAFMFYHWRGGALVRVLEYGSADEGVWCRAEGTAEDWEAEEFWSNEALKCAQDCAESDDQKARLGKYWQRGVIAKGEIEPSVSAEDAVWAAMKHYNLFSEPDMPSTPPVSSLPENAASSKPKGFWKRLFG